MGAGLGDGGIGVKCLAWSGVNHRGDGGSAGFEQRGGHDLIAKDPAPLFEAVVRHEHYRRVPAMPVDELEGVEGGGDR